MAKQQIMNRWTGAVLFECEVPDGLDSGMAMRHALEKAVEARANLTGAYLAGANLADANLTGANLAGAYLTGANLAGANLTGANLADANLTGAYLADAYLAGANLTGANLADAYLTGANLTDAYLADANLAGAKWRDGIVITQQPIQISGLHWFVTILDQHMQIGCELHSLHDWERYDDRRIAEMDGRDALRFWRAHKEALLSLARSAGRSFEPVEQPAESAEA